jgi:hypothetical protein
MMRRLVVLIVAAGLLSCGQGVTGGRVPPPAALPPATSSHVITIVMENKEYADVIGDSQAPYVNRLARRYGLATASFGVRHPSLPDYLALTGGSTHRIHSDCTACHVAATNVVDQLEAAHVTWKAYMQDMPSPCFRGASAAGYAKKHDPFIYYDDVARSPSRCRRIVPFSRLAGDLRSGRLPTYAFLSPNLCADTHDCGVRTGDRFLAHLLPTLLRAVGPQGYVVLTWDEGTTDRGCCGRSRGGHIATIVAGALVRHGASMRQPIDHYGVLRTIEDTLRLPHLGAARNPRHGRLDALFTRLPQLR